MILEFPKRDQEAKAWVERDNTRGQVDKRVDKPVGGVSWTGWGEMPVRPRYSSTR